MSLEESQYRLVRIAFLQQGYGQMILARLSLMPQHMHVTRAVKKEPFWRLNGTVQCSVVRASFAFIQVIAICMCNIDTGNDIFLRVFANNTQAQLLSFMGWSATSFNAHSLLCLWKKTLKSGMHAQNIFQPVWQPFQLRIIPTNATHSALKNVEQIFWLT